MYNKNTRIVKGVFEKPQKSSNSLACTISAFILNTFPFSSYSWKWRVSPAPLILGTKGAVTWLVSFKDEEDRREIRNPNNMQEGIRNWRKKRKVKLKNEFNFPYTTKIKISNCWIQKYKKVTHALMKWPTPKVIRC